MFELLAFGKPILRANHWEDLVSFVEELKELNKNTIDRRNYTVISDNGFNEIMYEWRKK